MEEKLLIAMSGGVDSSVAVKLMQDRGFKLHGVTFTVDGNIGEDCRDAAAVAEAYGIPHTVIDVSEEFRREVKDYFVSSYERGETPIPCVVCNRKIKFGLLWQWAEKLGCSGIVTGHYARLEKGDRVKLLRGRDKTKDQSYMLSSLSEEQLRRAYFPLGDYTKDEIRAMAEEWGIKTAHKKDSQDICFIPDGDYVRFLTEYRGREPIPGKYTDEAGRVLGDNRGHETLTVGQGRGLGIALGRHVYVLDKNPDSNTVVLGDEEKLYKSEVKLRDVCLIGIDGFEDGRKYSVKIRYSRGESEASVTMEDGFALLRFDSPVRAPAPGQLAVIYCGDCAVGSGTITK